MERIRCAGMAGARQYSLQRFDFPGLRPREISRKTPWFAPQSSGWRPPRAASSKRTANFARN